MSKTVYIAASWDAKEQAREIAQHVMRKGHVVTSGWIFFDDLAGMSQEQIDATIRSMDVGGVVAADELVIYTDVNSTKGGYHTELGVAVGWNEHMVKMGPFGTAPKTIVTIGQNPRPSGFYSGLKNYSTIEEFKETWE